MAIEIKPKDKPQTHGGNWVAVQVLLILAYILAPTPIHRTFSLPEVVRGLGLLALGGGALFSLGGLQGLGWTKTRIFPRPSPDAQLMTHGAYEFCRHPIYFGLLLMASGYAAYRQLPYHFALSAVLAVFFNFKSLREEKWLIEKFPDYAAYQTRVKRLIPGLF